MADADTSPSTPPPPAARPARPVSEALLNDKWDHAISTILIRGALGFSFGAIFSVLIFKRRAWPLYFGTGFGAGRGYEDADATFKRGGTQSSRDGLRLVRS